MNKSKMSWPSYNPQGIEAKLQAQWEEQGLYLAHSNTDKPKFYCLDFFPYPSGDGLHVGHCRNYVPTDVLSRYKRMQGFNVLHPMGWDAFGEPAEQFAVAHGVHPRVTTDQNTANFRRQMRMIGTSYDWSREIDSSAPEFYRWTQYFFLLLYQRGLAYRDTNWQWWCPTCQTTLSSHEVNDGVCWRGHTGVTRREIPAWYFKITAYAEQLLAGLDEIDWPERIKTMQRNWIGRSEGCEIIFQTEDGVSVPVFTTRPDTIYGVTFFVIAPEHPLVERLTTPDHFAEVVRYQEQSTRRSDSERLMENREKTGVFTGGYVINPLSAERVPVWVADYVLPSYGSGAIMGVPGHDSRDFQFASQYGLPVKIVIAAQVTGGQPSNDSYDGPGLMVNSGPYSGLDNTEGARRICAELQQRGLGGPKVIYRMRDWLISRQRYWGTPIPIVYCAEHGEQLVPEDQLPVQLPAMDEFQPDGSGRSPLARLPEFVNTTCPVCGGPARRETDTMGGFACSSWYFLRFTSPHHDQGPFDPDALKYWMPVDLYVGGAEHAVLHLLYARFWTRVMADAGLLPFHEPFTKLLNQGQLLAPDGSRMSKSRGNVITPDHVVHDYGADALRIYELFMAPFDQDIKWNTDGIHGSLRFLNRVWNLVAETYLESGKSRGSDAELERWLHKTIRKVSEKIESFRLNTMVSSLMEFVNVLAEKQQANEWHTATYHRSLETLLVILAPSAPHLADALWSLTDHLDSVHQQPWPAWEPELAIDELAKVAIQINGKVRDVIQAPVDASQEQVQEMALASPKVQSFLSDHSIDKTIYIPGKILSVVTTPKARKPSAD
jgi:leucyl-tRNA synthetase